MADRVGIQLLEALSLDQFYFEALAIFGKAERVAHGTIVLVAIEVVSQGHLEFSRCEWEGELVV